MAVWDGLRGNILNLTNHLVLVCILDRNNTGISSLVP